MLDIIIIAALVIYILGLPVCGLAFMIDYTAQVDFMFWLTMVLLWPLAWPYILIRAVNDTRARRQEEMRRDCESGARLCPKHYAALRDLDRWLP